MQVAAVRQVRSGHAADARRAGGTRDDNRPHLWVDGGWPLALGDGSGRFRESAFHDIACAAEDRLHLLQLLERDPRIG